MRRARTRGACSTARQGQPRAQASRRDDDRSPSELSSIPSCAPERGRVDDQYAKNGGLPNVRPLMLIATSFIIRATRFVAVVPRLSFRLGDQCVLYPRVSLSAPPLWVQYLANRPRLSPKVDGAVP